MNIKPIEDRVLLKEIKDGSNEKSFLYEVIAVWPWKDGRSTTVKVWDKILSWQYSWDDIKIDWKEYKILAMDYILAVVD